MEILIEIIKIILASIAFDILAFILLFALLICYIIFKGIKNKNK